jgi:transposase-like protein
MAKLGQQVDVYCGRCKVERYHTVAAISADGRIERVQCDYCQSTRAYKDPLSTTKKATDLGKSMLNRAGKLFGNDG